ncbi:MAG: hypothetical protein JJE19_06845 [Methanosarcinales archaeon]|nr:hypothetical protein [Methanosarcinales archaeon]
MTNSDKDTLYDFADKIDYKGIAVLGGGVVPTAQPTQPPTTETPTTPAEEGGETPGFEAIFAIVGLLAVMAILRGRDKQNSPSPSFLCSIHQIGK